MSKISNGRADRNRDQLEKVLDARDAVVMDVMREVFERLPYGQNFTLSDGSVAHLEKLAEPQLCSNESSDHFERPHFGIDVKMGSKTATFPPGSSWVALGIAPQGSGKEVTFPPPPPLRTARESFPSCSSSLHERPSQDAAAFVSPSWTWICR